MSSDMGDVSGTRKKPWKLSTPDGTVRFTAWRDPEGTPPAIVVLAGTEEIRFHLRSLNDLDEMLKERGDWMPLGAAEEGQAAAAGTVEAWARSSGNPVAGWYGLTQGRRGRFASYIPPIMVALDLAEIESARRRLRMRAR